MSVSKKIDHGAMVPLYYVEKEYRAHKSSAGEKSDVGDTPGSAVRNIAYSNAYSTSDNGASDTAGDNIVKPGKFKIVLISLADLPHIDVYRFGMCIGKAVAESKERVVFLASGDLSHTVSHDSPYGYNKKGVEFDNLLVKYVSEGDIKSIINFDRGFCEEAAQCGLRSFLIMFGALDGYNIYPQVYSYEGPFGIGYAVAKIKIGDINSKRKLYEEYKRDMGHKMNKLREGEDFYVSLARFALETYVREGRVVSQAEYSQKFGNLPEEMVRDKAGTFVSLKKDGALRGCIGTIKPTKKNVAEEIIYNAISAGTQDPRFFPVGINELDDLVYSVDVLGEAEPIESMEQLDVVKYGVIVRAGYRSGLLLPNLEGVNTPEEQISIALKKAGISPREKYTMERFQVIRHEKGTFLYITRGHSPT
ncbi:MAG: AmmeMemoRadiSam system protein A [Clostridiaceae bacterium]|nr:AmmeMemoRadiSam system protein A [Clostridiaceae bacterium]